MRLSIFTTCTHPAKRGDLSTQSFSCYKGLADELIVVNGDEFYTPHVKYGDDFKEVHCWWEKEFDWPFIGQQFQRGYETCTGDWVIHADLDFIFHERDYDAIRKACEDNPDAPALSLWKYHFILPDRYNLKSRLVIAVNKGKYGNRIRFDSGGDLCQPSLDGNYIRPEDVPEARIPFYCYEKILKTKEQVSEDVGRMDRAYKKHFDKYLYSQDGTDESAFSGWMHMVYGRCLNKPQKHIPLDDHPKVMQNTIKQLKPEQFGYNGFEFLGANDYVKSSSSK